MENCHQKQVEIQVANEVCGKREVAQWKSNRDNILFLSESQAKIIWHKLVGTREFWHIEILYFWVDLVTIRTLREVSVWRPLK
jgi:hypothetical protein